jgi:hypothetical protein
MSWDEEFKKYKKQSDDRGLIITVLAIILALKYSGWWILLLILL